MDRIVIREFELNIHIGVPDEERKHPQRVVCDLELEMDLQPAARSEKLEDTVCYVNLRQQIEELANSRHWILVETLAEESCRLVFALHPSIQKIQFQIRKFVVPNTKWVGVTITRTKSG